MMSLQQIAEESRRAARKAAREHKKPYLFEEEDRLRFRQGQRFPFPNIGDYRPKGWELIKSYFVDFSGFGVPGEPALTVDQFLNRLKSGFGYAIIEAGEFQVYVGEFTNRSNKRVKKMSAGWLYYHKYPPKRKCPKCGKRQYLKRQGAMSNGADVWLLACKCGQVGGRLASDWPEGGLI